MQDEEYICGVNPVCQAIMSGKRRIRRLLIVKKRDNKRLEAIIEMAAARGIFIQWMDGAQMAVRFPDREDQGVAALISPYPYCSLEEILMTRKRPAMLVALDEVQDPRNLGSIVRSAAAFDCDGIVIHKRRSAQVTSLAVKASSGMTEQMKIARVVNLSSSIRQVKSEGIRVLGLDADSPRSLYDEDLKTEVIFVMGSEGRGLRRLTSSLCDGLVSIPMSASCESLNVSTASAIAVAEASRQRRASIR